MFVFLHKYRQAEYPNQHPNQPSQKSLSATLLVQCIGWLSTQVKGLLVLSTLLISSMAYALPSDATQPIRLVADKATFSERTGITKYSGNVVITQGTLTMKAENITVNLSDTRRIQTAFATGRPARLQQLISRDKGLAVGQANSIEYDSVTGIVTLIGNAKLKQNGASFSGNRIRYSLKAGDVEATAGKGKRVELVFPSNSISTLGQ